jgi:UDP-glucose 4-epimerase
MNAIPRSVFITGAGGYLGTEIVRRLSLKPDLFRVTAFDLKDLPSSQRLTHVRYVKGDVRDPALVDLVKQAHADTIVHLASIVSPGGPDRREFEHSVDVGGTENVLRAAVQTGARHLIVTSSGAAYGYYADNPTPLTERDSLRGNPEFPYADHKRQIEEILARFRKDHPQLKQLVLRPGTVLGTHTDNPITRLFQGKIIVGVAGFETPFVFIWDQDVAEIVERGIEREIEGIFNLAGDGTLTLREIARLIGKPYLPIPAFLFRTILSLGRMLRLSTNGPEQLIFLQYRPVLSNEKLHREFPYDPKFTTRVAFDHYWSNNGGKRDA